MYVQFVTSNALSLTIVSMPIVCEQYDQMTIRTPELIIHRRYRRFLVLIRPTLKIYIA